MSRLTRALRISGRMESHAPDVDTLMRIHAIRGGRVYVTSNGRKPREGVLVEWRPRGRFVARVCFNPERGPLHLSLKHYGVERIR